MVHLEAVQQVLRPHGHVHARDEPEGPRVSGIRLLQQLRRGPEGPSERLIALALIGLEFGIVCHPADDAKLLLRGIRPIAEDLPVVLVATLTPRIGDIL